MHEGRQVLERRVNSSTNVYLGVENNVSWTSDVQEEPYAELPP